jgi:hypothetical protein
MFSGLVPTSQPVPNWAVASAVGAPVALVTSTSLATLLPTTPYDPFGQTMSVLAATPRSAPVMTIGFVLTAMCQIATAAGLHVLLHALGGMRLGRPRRLGPVGQQHAGSGGRGKPSVESTWGSPSARRSWGTPCGRWACLPPPGPQAVSSRARPKTVTAQRVCRDRLHTKLFGYRM